MTAESRRLQSAALPETPWKKWGPYLADRQWGTVREDYSADGDAWRYFTYETARRRAYRWGEDGIGGISDDRQLLCLAHAFWNTRDPHLKERLFGLSGPEGNHGEDVKELYYYLDCSPTHSYMKMLYKYPQGAFPYERLRQENARRGKQAPEFELLDTGLFDEDRYWDIFVEVAKAEPEDILVQITAWNRGPQEAQLHLVPELWFRNTWSWAGGAEPPLLAQEAPGLIAVTHQELGAFWFSHDQTAVALFCDNVTDTKRLYGKPSTWRYFKDGISEAIVGGHSEAVNPALRGTRAGIWHRCSAASGGSCTVRLRLSRTRPADPWKGFDETLALRKHETDEFYAELQEGIDHDEGRMIQRQAFAGLLWTKQFYYYDVREWLSGDPAQPVPPTERLRGRNREWVHLNNQDIISMPDKWEYPWYAAWDLAFHCLPLAMVDAEFAKHQLVLLTREWYMHPNGQLPAYEWAFSDVNPPVHASATWRVYKIDQKRNGGKGDTDFLERVFHKLLLNFTWWVNRKDAEGKNVFQGGFLGLDNIGVFDRSQTLPTGGTLDQADGTSWMAMYSLALMRISLELALTRPIYQDMATKFFEHFLYIAGAMNNIGGEGFSLWDQEDEFYYDVLHASDGHSFPFKIRSLVGLIPLLAVEVLEPELLNKLPEFRGRLEWFLANRPDLAGLVSRWHEPGVGERKLLSLLRGHRMKRLLRRMLDETEFLSDYGVRSLSRFHEQHPYVVHLNGAEMTVRYQPAESDSMMFGGNSNWRGPVWVPVNFVIIEALHRFHHYYGDDFKVEYPTGSGHQCTIKEIAEELTRRLTRIFLKGPDGRRPVFGTQQKFQDDPHFRDYILFYEYFHGDTGQGLGASHQTGWTALIGKLVQSRDVWAPQHTSP
jgi:hypothetical protein